MVKQILYRLFSKRVSYRKNKSQLKDLTSNEVFLTSIMHINDVKSLGLRYLSEVCMPDLMQHDFTKIEYFKEFIEAKNTEANFKNEKWWYKIHMDLEPHHALEYRGKETVTLWHFLHMAIDWTCAARVRSKDGKFHYQIKPEEFEKELVKAFRNTILQLNDMVMTEELTDEVLE